MNNNNRLQYSIDLSVKPINFFGTLNQHITQVTASTQKMTVNFGDSWKKLLSANQLFEGIRNLKSALDGAIQPGIALNSSMADLSAITGLTGKALGEISDAARASAKSFGTDAAQNVESYKLLLSQLSPDIAKNSGALKEMGNHVNILSKTMGGNTVAATEVLTTAMNQYGVSLDDPMQASKTMADMMNVMAAAAKEGSAELPQIKSALEQVGMVAKTTGVTFSETNAAIQVLDKAGKKGSEGGVALRNTLSTLSEGRFLPKQTKAELEAAGVSIAQLGDKSIPLTTRLNALKPIINDTALITKLFGKENAAAAIALINGSEAIDDYNTKIQGTNTAFDQAKVVMGSYQERMNRVTAIFDDFKIRLFNLTQNALPLFQATMLAASGIGQMTSSLNVFKTIGGRYITTVWNATKSLFTKTTAIQADTVATGLNASATSGASMATKVWTGIQRVFNVVMAANPIGAIIRAVLLLTAGVIAATTAYSAYTKNQDMAKTVSNQLNSQILVEKRGLNDLFDQLQRTNPASQRRKELIEEMNARYPGLLDYQKLEAASEKDIEKARRKANDELERTIILSAEKTQKEAFVKKVTEKEKEISDVLFEKGGSDKNIAKLFTAVSTITEGMVKSGKYQPGLLSGASNLQIDEVYRQLATDPELKTLITKDRWSKLRGLIDAQLSGFNESAAYQRFVETKLGKTSSKEEAPKAPNDNTKLDKAKNKLSNLGAAAATSAKNTQSKSDKLGVASDSSRSSGNRSLTINKLVETIIVKVERLPESKERIKDAVSEALLLAVNDYNLAT